MSALIELLDGTKVPQLGFGTFKIPPDPTATPQNTATTAQVVGEALQVGYRHVDTAQMYGNETGVGQAIAMAGLPREQLYVTSKLGNGNHAPPDVHRTFAESLDRLGLEQLDLFLIHWPLPTRYDGDYTATWQTMVELVKEGRLRSAGVSNFQPAHLEKIIDATGVVPVVNQIEIHPYFRNEQARAACSAHGIAIEAWSPLGQGAVLADPVVTELAARHDARPAQVILAWHLHHGHIVIPKTTHPDRMRENLAALDMRLSQADVAALDALDRGPAGRIGPNPDTFDRVG